MRVEPYLEDKPQGHKVELVRISTDEAAAFASLPILPKIALADL